MQKHGQTCRIYDYVSIAFPLFCQNKTTEPFNKSGKIRTDNYWGYLFWRNAIRYLFESYGIWERFQDNYS